MRYKATVLLNKKGHSVEGCCKLLQTSTSGFYDWINYKASHRKQRDDELKPMIANVFYQNKQVYGYPRIQKTLEAQGEVVGKNRVAKLMQELDLKALYKKAFRPQTTLNNPKDYKAERVFKIEDTVVSQPNEVWASDLTYLPMEKGFAYLVAVMDLFDRSILGWDVSDNMNAENTDKALLIALRATSGSLPYLVFHSDQGSQYSADCVRERLRFLGITQSMSRKGNCYDNAFVESFFHTLKNELPKKTFTNVQDAREVLFAYIDGWYNTKRLHSSLGYVSPMEYRKAFGGNHV